MRTTQEKIQRIIDAMRKELYGEIEKSYRGNPTPEQRQEAKDAIEELIASLDVEHMSTADLDSVSFDLGLADRPLVDVEDRR